MADADDRDLSIANASAVSASGDAKSMSFDIDLIRNNPLSQVIIRPTIRGDIVQGATEANSTITAWCANDTIAINGEAAFSSEYEDALAYNISMRGTAMLNRFGQKSYPTFAIQLPAQTVKAWSGSSAFALDLDLYFIAVSDEDDITREVAKLLNLVYPIRGENPNIVVAPMGHQAAVASATTGGICSVKIGNWFNAPPFFVCKSVTNDVVVKTKKDGKPLYARARIHLESHQIVAVQDIRTWIGQGGPDSGTPTSDIHPGEDLVRNTKKIANEVISGDWSSITQGGKIIQDDITRGFNEIFNPAPTTPAEGTFQLRTDLDIAAANWSGRKNVSSRPNAI